MAHKTSDLLTGVLIGGAVGVIIGILYAPKSGRETREELLTGAEELMARAKREYEEALERSRRAYEAALSRIGEMELKDKVESIDASLHSVSAGAREALQEGKDRLKRAVEAGVEAFKEQ
ncbi:MAG: YtxH domain-containing protein [Smithellaceae bacterium]|nr:YtxH domain-containing protein [Smithellaceae bacterium]